MAKLEKYFHKLALNHKAVGHSIELVYGINTKSKKNIYQK